MVGLSAGIQKGVFSYYGSSINNPSSLSRSLTNLLALVCTAMKNMSPKGSPAWLPDSVRAAMRFPIHHEPSVFMELM